MSKFVKFCQKFVKICQNFVKNLSKFVKILSKFVKNLSKTVKNCQNLSKNVKSCQNLESQNSDFWARAFAQSDGDEKKQKVIYVKLRAKELDAEYEARISKDFNEQKRKDNIILLGILITVFVVVIFYANSI